MPQSNENTPWWFDEFQPVGRDYGCPEEVEVYDSSHADFRDIRVEANRVLDRLALSAGATLIDFGCGTGIFALEAARRGLRVHAVDVSEAMLSHAKTRAEKEHADAITFHHAGFLTFEHPDHTADAITTTFAFHHLPDFWKGIALGRIHRMLNPGGWFYMHDVILGAENSLANIARFIEQQEAAGGDFLRADAEGHFRDEYSTYDWVMEGLLARVGFEIVDRQMQDGVLGTYFCKTGK